MSASNLFGHATRAALAFGFFIGASQVATGCSNDDNTKPGGPVVIGSGGEKSDAGGKGGSGKGGAGGATNAGGSGDTAGGSGTDASAGGPSTGGSGDGGPQGSGGSATDSGSGGSGGSTGSDAGCDPATGKNGCFNCPSTTDEFLHQCTTPDVQCSPYDNSKLSLFHGYPLPAVP